MTITTPNIIDAKTAKVLAITNNEKLKQKELTDIFLVIRERATNGVLEEQFQIVHNEIPYIKKILTDLGYKVTAKSDYHLRVSWRDAGVMSKDDVGLYGLGGLGE